MGAIDKRVTKFLEKIIDASDELLEMVVIPRWNSVEVYKRDGEGRQMPLLQEDVDEIIEIADECDLEYMVEGSIAVFIPTYEIDSKSEE